MGSWWNLPVANVHVQNAHYPKSDEGSCPVHKKHNSHTQKCANQRHPGTVVLEGRSPENNQESISIINIQKL